MCESTTDGSRVESGRSCCCRRRASAEEGNDEEEAEDDERGGGRGLSDEVRWVNAAKDSVARARFVAGGAMGAEAAPVLLLAGDPCGRHAAAEIAPDLLLPLSSSRRRSPWRPAWSISETLDLARGVVRRSCHGEGVQ